MADNHNRVKRRLLTGMTIFKWYYFTRGLGAVMMVYGLLWDETGDRATILLIAAGMLGFDAVARNEKKD